MLSDAFQLPQQVVLPPGAAHRMEAAKQRQQRHGPPHQRTPSVGSFFDLEDNSGACLLDAPHDVVGLVGSAAGMLQQVGGNLSGGGASFQSGGSAGGAVGMQQGSSAEDWACFNDDTCATTAPPGAALIVPPFEAANNNSWTSFDSNNTSAVPGAVAGAQSSTGWAQFDEQQQQQQQPAFPAAFKVSAAPSSSLGSGCDAFDEPPAFGEVSAAGPSPAAEPVTPPRPTLVNASTPLLDHKETSIIAQSFDACYGSPPGNAEDAPFRNPLFCSGSRRAAGFSAPPETAQQSVAAAPGSPGGRGKNAAPASVSSNGDAADAQAGLASSSAGPAAQVVQKTPSSLGNGPLQGTAAAPLPPAPDSSSAGAGAAKPAAQAAPSSNPTCLDPSDHIKVPLFPDQPDAAIGGDAGSLSPGPLRPGQVANHNQHLQSRVAQLESIIEQQQSVIQQMQLHGSPARGAAASPANGTPRAKQPGELTSHALNLSPWKDPEAAEDVPSALTGESAGSGTAVQRQASSSGGSFWSLHAAQDGGQ